MPTPERFSELWEYARSKGLDRPTATAYASLMWWGEHYRVPAAEIVSGRRSVLKQTGLRIRWALGRRSGLAVRPAAHSQHIPGEAFDLARSPYLPFYARLAPSAGLEWGGWFRAADDVHFQRPRSAR